MKPNIKNDFKIPWLLYVYVKWGIANKWILPGDESSSVVYTITTKKSRRLRTVALMQNSEKRWKWLTTIEKNEQNWKRWKRVENW